MLFTLDAYTELMEDCNNILLARGLPEISAEVSLTDEWLSYTNCVDEIRIGRIVQTLSKCRLYNPLRTMMHEMVHILVHNHWPNKKIRDTFGSPAEWSADQSFRRLLTNNVGAYSTPYGMSHPEEDFVETVTNVLLQKRFLGRTPEQKEKIRVVENWLAGLIR